MLVAARSPGIVAGGIGGAGVLAPPMGVGRDVRLRRPSLCLRACIADGRHPIGGFHVIGRIARDPLGLDLPDRVFRLIGNKRRLGAGRPCPGPVSVGDAVRTLAAPRLTRARAAGSRGDSLPVSIGACRAVLHQ